MGCFSLHLGLQLNVLVYLSVSWLIDIYDIVCFIWHLSQAVKTSAFHADDMGSTPIGVIICSHGQVVKSSAFHADVMGSNPIESTIKDI